MRFYSMMLGCFLVCLLLLPMFAVAGSFKVLPLKLSLDSNTKTTLFKVINTDEQAVIVQLQAVDWQQDAQGEDVFVNTRDIVLFPKIVKLQADEERVVRIGFQAKTNSNEEKNYRIFAQELPQRNLPGGTLNFALRFSVPVFIKPEKTRENYTIASSSIENGWLKLVISNTGNQHIMLSSLTVNGVDESNQHTFNVRENGWYVLPDVVKPFYISLPQVECKSSSRLDYTVEIASKLHRKSIVVDPANCNKQQI